MTDARQADNLRQLLHLFATATPLPMSFAGDIYDLTIYALEFTGDDRRYVEVRGTLPAGTKIVFVADTLTGGNSTLPRLL